MNNDELEKIHKQLLDLEWRVKFLEMGMEDSVEFSKFVVDCINELQKDIRKLKK
jgi:hypothetical protein